VKVNYHVLFSDTWQVPMLHFLPMWDDTLEPLDLKEIYEYVVETLSRDSIKEVGVQGGISHGVGCQFSIC
jgi:Autophagocytosis associated protein, active-site domain